MKAFQRPAGMGLPVQGLALGFLNWLRAVFLAQPTATPLRFGDVETMSWHEGAVLAPLALLDEVAPELARGKPGTVDARLPADHLLRRELIVPWAARSRLRQVAALDLIRRSPFSADEVYWGLEPPERRDTMLRVVQWVVRREDVARLGLRLRGCGLELRRVGVWGRPVTLVDLGEQGQWARRLRRTNLALLGAILAVCLALWLSPAVAALWHAGRRGQHLEVARAEAFELRSQIDGLRADQTRRSDLLVAISQHPRLIQLLRDLTVALPDEAWISELRLRDRMVQIDGETQGAAADLVLRLSKQRSFAEPRLTGAVARTATGSERFELSFDLRAAE